MVTWHPRHPILPGCEAPCSGSPIATCLWPSALLGGHTGPQGHTSQLPVSEAPL